jgi:hypothetical protein
VEAIVKNHLSCGANKWKMKFNNPVTDIINPGESGIGIFLSISASWG